MYSFLLVYDFGSVAVAVVVVVVCLLGEGGIRVPSNRGLLNSTTFFEAFPSCRVRMDQRNSVRGVMQEFQDSFPVDVGKLFGRLNHQYFDGKLKSVRVKWDSKMTM